MGVCVRVFAKRERFPNFIQLILGFISNGFSQKCIKKNRVNPNLSNGLWMTSKFFLFYNERILNHINILCKSPLSKYACINSLS